MLFRSLAHGRAVAGYDICGVRHVILIVILSAAKDLITSTASIRLIVNDLFGLRGIGHKCLLHQVPTAETCFEFLPEQTDLHQLNQAFPACILGFDKTGIAEATFEA